MNKNIIWSLFLLLSILTSCNEDDSFAGNDNYITSFTLTQGEQTISATFQGDTIHMLLSLIHISEPTRRTPISYAVFCLKKKN